MPFIRNSSNSVFVMLGALAVVFHCGLLPAQSQPQNTVPHPPDTLRPLQQSPVPRPPESQRQAAQADADQQPNTTIKVNVKLVNVFTTVTDSAGSPISSLKE